MSVHQEVHGQRWTEVDRGGPWTGGPCLYTLLKNRASFSTKLPVSFPDDKCCQE